MTTPGILQPGATAPVPSSYTQGLMQGLARRGLCRDGLLWRAGFAWDPLCGRPQTRRITPQQYSRLLALLFRELSDETLGSMPDAPTPPGTLRLVALSMLGASQLGVAMRRATEFNACCRARRHRPTENRLSIDGQGRIATLSYLGRGVAPRHEHRLLAGLGLWLRFCGWLIGQEIDVLEARCAGPEPGRAAALRHFMPCPVTFGAETNAVTFSARHLEAPILRSEADLAGFLSLAPWYLLVAPEAGHQSTAYRIRQLLGEDFSRPMPSFDELTGLLGMSARTLRRRLEREGTSYQRIKDTARRDLAITLLRDQQLSVVEVAEHLGFSDPSAFHRSFRRWTGRSPGRFR